MANLPLYEELEHMYNAYFSLQFLGSDISNKFALISLTCYIVDKLKEKKPDVTHWSVLYNINKKGGNPVPEDLLKRLAVLCSDFGYGCSKFPTFELEDKKIPAKIKELLNMWTPF